MQNFDAILPGITTYLPKSLCRPLCLSYTCRSLEASLHLIVNPFYCPSDIANAKSYEEAMKLHSKHVQKKLIQESVSNMKTDIMALRMA